MKRAGQGTPDSSEGNPDAADSLRRIAVAVSDARHGSAEGSAQFLSALALLRELRTQIAAWEPDLIDAARSGGASWAQLAPVLGVASRQAAERRYLRLRPSSEDQDRASTGDQRVQAERDRRAGRRAVAHWARDHAADLRQLAGQISALNDLPTAADGRLADLRRALGGDDAAELLGPLADTHDHLEPGYPALAARLREIAASTDSVQRGTQDRRQADRSEA
jgi:hypothetical protein